MRVTVFGIRRNDLNSELPVCLAGLSLDVVGLGFLGVLVDICCDFILNRKRTKFLNHSFVLFLATETAFFFVE